MSAGLPHASGPGDSGGRSFAHPSVLAAIAAGESWADPQMDPTGIDWAKRQQEAWIPFQVVNGRPVNPCERTGARFGRNELGHWGEQKCTDAVVTITGRNSRRWLVMVERSDGYGWALPGGCLNPGEDPIGAAVRELAEETGLIVDPSICRPLAPRYVPDPRASDESWMVTTPVRIDLGTSQLLPRLAGGDDARQACWILAATFEDLCSYLAVIHNGTLFPAHRDLLAELLG